MPPCDYKKDYHPRWTLIVRLIRKRSGNKCEWCGAPNGELIYREDGIWNLAPEGHLADAMALDGTRFTKVCLTTAHIDHNKNNNRFSNLAHLCQKCHLNHDRHQHADNRRYGRNWKRDQISLSL